MNHSPIGLAAPLSPPPGRRYFPTVATYVLIAVDVIIFALMTASGGSKNVNVLLEYGASYGPSFRAGEYWRLVMPMFLHIGWEHLATNMFALWLLGNFLEPLYGYGRFTLLYVLSGMGGALLSMEASTHIAAGASGAIFGVAGAMLITGILHPETIPRRWKDVFGIGILLVIILNLIFGHFVHHIDNWAHLGGLITGLVLAWLIPPARVAGARWIAKTAQPILAIPVIIVAVAMVATANHAVAARNVTSLLDASSRLASNGKTEQAAKALAKARRLAPRDPRVSEAEGLLALQTHQYDKAIREFSSLLKQAPDEPAVVIRLALAYEANHELPKARELLESSVKRIPKNPAILEMLAEVLTRQHAYPEAIQRYNQALKLAPNSALIQNNLAWLYATSKDPQVHNPALALKHAFRAVQLTQGRAPSSLDTLAAAFFANGKYQEAADAEARAVELDPQNPVFRQNWLNYRTAAGK